MVTAQFVLVSVNQVFHQVVLSIDWDILISQIHVPHNFFHQNFSTIDYGEDKFFGSLTVLCNFILVIVNSCPFVTFYPIFFVAVFIHFCCGVLVLSSQIPAQNSSNFFHSRYILFQLLRSLCLSIEHFSFFLIMYPCMFDLYGFHLYVTTS